jgi:hypothetical protein
MIPRRSALNNDAQAITTIFASDKPFAPYWKSNGGYGKTSGLGAENLEKMVGARSFT